MERVKYRAATLLLALVLIAPLAGASAASDGYSGAYTYTYDDWSDTRESPDAYRVAAVLDGETLGLDKDINKPEGLFIRDRDIYLCDTGNHRILQIRRDGTDYTLTRTIDAFEGDDVNTFDMPSDVFVDEAGNLYVADTNHHRIVKIDKDLRLVRTYTVPLDPSFQQGATYLPKKVTVDARGNVYCLALNVNKGLIKYAADGRFVGFVGANKAKYNLYDYIWKAFLSTREQREQLADFVPTEYENIYIDHAGFIYATNTTFQEWDLLSDAAKPIRRLNVMGDDILIKNDRYAPVGDLVWSNGGSISGPSKMADITALDNDVYIALDRVRGRLFGYDSQGLMLWAFGATGNQNGAFIQPSAIDHMGYDLYAVDKSKCNITVFTPTGYGALIYRATEAYADGRYEQAAEDWAQTLVFNANYELAFVGIGRALMHQEKYGEAMEYFRMARDKENYGKAFRLYRKEWVERHIGALALGAVAALALCIALKKARANGRGGALPARGKRALAARRYARSLRYSLHVMTHPFDGFWDLTREKRGTLGAATTFLALFLLAGMVKRLFTGFQFTDLSVRYLNVFKECAVLLLPFLIVCVANWGMTTLFDGKGTLKDIYIVMCYALVPYAMIQLPLTLLSHVMTFDEAQLYSVLTLVSVLWTGLLILIGLMKVHDYSPGKTLVFVALTAFASLVIIFLMTALFSLLSNLWGFCVTVYREIVFRLY